MNKRVLVGVCLVVVLAAGWAWGADKSSKPKLTGFKAMARAIMAMEGVDQQEKERLLQAAVLYRLLEPGAAASQATMEVLDKVRQMRASLGQTGMLILGQDLPTLRGYLNRKLDKLKKYAGTIGSLQRVMGALDLAEKVRGVWDWGSTAAGALKKFESAGYRDLNPRTRAALSYLHWFGQQVQNLGGKTPLVGKAIEAYGSFVSQVSQALADNATRLITGLRGGRLMAGMNNMHLTRGFSEASGGGIPAVTEVLKATDWKVVLLLDDNTRRDLKPAYYLRVAEGGGAPDWVKVDPRRVGSVVADWMSAFHPPKDPRLRAALAKVADYQRLRQPVPREAAMGPWPSGREIVFLINPRWAGRPLPTRGISRKRLRELARRSREMAADALQMAEVYGGLSVYEGGRARLSDFRDDRRHLRRTCRVLAIALDPRRENKLLRQYFLNGRGKVDGALKKLALRLHRGAAEWLACQEIDPLGIDTDRLGALLGRYRRAKPFMEAEFLVVDQAEGKPIAGAWLKARVVRRCGVRVQDELGSRAGGDGRIKLVLPLGCYRFSFGAEGFKTRRTKAGRPVCLVDKAFIRPKQVRLAREVAATGQTGGQVSGELDCECVRRKVVAAAKKHYEKKCRQDPDCSRLVWLGSKWVRIKGGGCGVYLRFSLREGRESGTKVALRPNHPAVRSCLRSRQSPPTTQAPRANPCAHNPGCGDCRGLTIGGPCLQWCMQCRKFKSR